MPLAAGSRLGHGHAHACSRPVAPAGAMHAQKEQHATQTTLSLSPCPTRSSSARERAMSLIGEKSDRLLFAELGLFPAC